MKIYEVKILSNYLKHQIEPTNLRRSAVDQRGLDIDRVYDIISFIALTDGTTWSILSTSANQIYNNKS